MNDLRYQAMLNYPELRSPEWERKICRERRLDILFAYLLISIPAGFIGFIAAAFANSMWISVAMLFWLVTGLTTLFTKKFA